MWTLETRDHYRIVRCEQCPNWIETPGAAPVKAHTIARRHAKRYQHATVVIDLVSLTIEHRYELIGLFDGEEAPF